MAPITQTRLTNISNSAGSPASRVCPPFDAHLSYEHHQPKVVSKTSSYTYHSDRFRVRTTFFPNINATRAYLPPFLCIESSCDHGQDFEMNSMKDDMGVLCWAYAQSNRGRTLHIFCRGKRCGGIYDTRGGSIAERETGEGEYRRDRSGLLHSAIYILCSVDDQGEFIP